MKKIIYLTGGCFWGVSEYFSRLKGVLEVTCGYANGKTVNPSYEEVKSQKTGHAETVKIIYDNEILSIDKLIEHFLRFVDPYSLNKQGEDEGIQYRSGIYYVDVLDGIEVEKAISKRLNDKHVIEITTLKNFYPAEEYHQNYLKKNPDGYCHVNLGLIKDDERK